MSITFVQKSTLTGSSTFSSSRQSSALGSNPVVGNYLVAWFFGNGLSGDTATAPTFSDTAGGNTWVVPSNIYQRSTSQVFFCMAYAKIANSGSSFQVTGTMPAGITAKSSIFVAEYTGVAGTSPVDGTPVGNISNTTVTSFSLGNMTVSASSLTLAGCCNSDGSINASMSTPTNFTLVQAQTDVSTIIGIGQGIYGIGLSSPTNPSWTDANGGTWAGSQFALLAAGSAGGIFKPAWVRQGVTLGMAIYERIFDWKKFFRPRRRIFQCS